MQKIARDLGMPCDSYEEQKEVLNEMFLLKSFHSKMG